MLGSACGEQCPGARGGVREQPAEAVPRRAARGGRSVLTAWGRCCWGGRGAELGAEDCRRSL